MKLKSWSKVLLAAALFGSGLGLGSMFTSNADGIVDPNQPGSVGDPMVTKSYVDQQVQQMVKNELSKQSVSDDKIKQLINEATKNLQGTAGAATGLKVVTLTKGQVLYAGTGTEFIVRKGNAVAFSDDGNGIPDLTAGKDIASGELIALNHLLLFPRDGGRGIKPESDASGTLYVMVRGKYLLVDPDGKKTGN